MKKIYKKHQLKNLSIQSFVTDLDITTIKAGLEFQVTPIAAPASFDACTYSSSPC